MKLEHYINDFSWKVNKNTIHKINEKFKNYKEKTKTEIATVFIKHRKWRELKDIALEIFNENWIWWKETNSWLLLIVVTWEKKIRIMTGKWMELEFPENLCRDIIENELRPLLNKSQYSEIIKVWFELSTKNRKVKKKILINEIFKTIFPIFSIFLILVFSMFIGIYINNLLISFYLFLFIWIISSITKNFLLIIISSLIALFWLYNFNSEIPKLWIKYNDKTYNITNNQKSYEEIDWERKKYDFDKYNNIEVDTTKNDFDSDENWLENVSNNDLNDNYENASSYESNNNTSNSTSDWWGGSSNGGGYGD